MRTGLENSSSDRMEGPAIGGGNFGLIKKWMNTMPPFMMI